MRPNQKSVSIDELSREERLDLATKLASVLVEVERIWPFKRIEVPQHILDEHNAANPDSKYKLTESFITVDKNYEPTDDDFRKALSFGRSETIKELEHNPPHTGRAKRSL